MTAATGVSIVVCTCDRAELLRGALASLVAQQIDEGVTFEIVVVDNSSAPERDGTAPVVEAFREAVVPVRRVHEPRRGIPFARNRGVAESRGPWIAFFDDDQIAEPDWLRELLRMQAETGALCVGGAVRLRFTEGESRVLPPECRALLGESVGLDSPRRYSRKTNPGAGNLLLHRSVFDRVGTFDESLRAGGEDTELFQRIRAAGIDAWYTPRAVVWHLTPAARLQDEYLRRVCLRVGSHVARRERADWGRLGFLLVAVPARLGQVLLWHVPCSVGASLAGTAPAYLAARCRVWRGLGYLHFVLGRE